MHVSTIMKTLVVMENGDRSKVGGVKIWRDNDRWCLSTPKGVMSHPSAVVVARRLHNILAGK